MTSSTTSSTLHDATDSRRASEPRDFLPSYRGEPLGRSLSPRACPAAFGGATALRFEFSSRGDRVPGRLLLPKARSGPFPLVLALGGAGSHCDSTDFDLFAGLVRGGFAIATLDLSLCGERRSAKFSERLLAAIANAERVKNLDANGQALLVEFTRQSVRDVSRALDTLATLPAIDATRVAILGVGHGAALAAIVASVDPRMKATLLAGCSAVDLQQIDPRGFVQAISPREVLVLDADGTPDHSSIYEACIEPRTRHIVSSSGATLDDDAAKVALDFLTRHLGND